MDAGSALSLGPRLVTLVTEAGEEQPLSVRIEFTEVRRFELGDGDSIDMQIGVVFVESERITLTSDAVGDDHLNVAYRLMLLAGGYVLKRSNELGLSVFKYEPGDVKEWQDLFS
jgi:hypothetical protein